jgi:hypothetical protein
MPRSVVCGGSGSGSGGGGSGSGSGRISASEKVKVGGDWHISSRVVRVCIEFNKLTSMLCFELRTILISNLLR